MRICRWCGEDIETNKFGDFCSENCLLNLADHHGTTIEERSKLLAQHDAWLDALEKRKE